jgi:hypothetical protein
MGCKILCRKTFEIISPSFFVIVFLNGAVLAPFYFKNILILIIFIDILSIVNSNERILKESNHENI